MARWLVELKGDAMSLEDLPYWFPDGSIHAIAEQDKVFLVGESLENYGEASEVYGAALQAVDEFSAVISLLWSNFERPSISLVLRESDEGKRHAHIFASSFLTVRGKMRLSSQANLEPTQAQQLLHASRKNRHLRAAVLVWGDPLRTWSRLYHVLDELQKALGKSVSEAGFCTKDELNRFKGIVTLTRG